MERGNEPSAVRRLRDLQNRLAVLTAKDDLVSDVPKEELYSFILAILEYDSGLCMDNEEERTALASVISTELKHFYKTVHKGKI